MTRFKACFMVQFKRFQGAVDGASTGASRYPLGAARAGLRIGATRAAAGLLAVELAVELLGGLEPALERLRAELHLLVELLELDDGADARRSS